MVEIRDLPENSYFKGQYRNGVIYLRKNLNPTEKARILKHEYAHYHFYEYTLGRILDYFLEPEQFLVYGFVLTLTWILSPYLFLALSIPLVLIEGHEALTSIKHPSRRSLVCAALIIMAILLMGTVRMFMRVF